MADVREAKVPDIGDFQGVPVIEVMVKPGDHVDKDQGLVTLESAKATMEVPAPFAGTVKEVKVKVGDDVAEGSVVATIEADAGGEAPAKPAPAAPAKPAPTQAEAPPPTAATPPAPAKAAPQPSSAQGGAPAAERRTPPVPFDADSIMPDKVPYASPAVRAFARELGVDIARVSGDRKSTRLNSSH